MAICWIPRVSDKYGRYPFIHGSLLLQLFCQIGLVHSHSLYFAYFCMFCLGMTFPGKNIIFYNYTMEVVNPAKKQLVVTTQALCETSLIIPLSFFYQRISNNWMYVQYVSIGMTLTSFIFVSFWLEESPLFLYNKGLYSKAKSSLRKMARFNGLDIDENFIFDKEEEQLNLVQ